MSNILVEHSDYIIVAAIDFGTTYSGYAFSFKTSQEDIKMNKNWGSNVGFQSYKTPTCVLVDQRGGFHSFGYEAEVKYGEIVEGEGDPDQWSMFRHFKMALHSEEKITRTKNISSIGGSIRPAMDVFAMALAYLKRHLIEAVSRQLVNPPDDNMIRWVVTVPAIWTDESKHFMREAAFKAGLMTSVESRQLVIALEPEAASLSCRRLDVGHFKDNCGGQIRFQSGSQYLVIDSGGGTVDVTAHEILSRGGVRELHSATGGAWGGTKVDENYIKLLGEILGTKFLNTYKQECAQQWFTMMTGFERLKRAAKPDGKSTMNIPLSWSLGCKYPEIMSGKTVEQAVKAATHLGVTFANGAMVIEHKKVVELFQPVIDNIVTHIDKLMHIPKLQSCKYFFLVGGFSESEFLQEAIKDKFKERVEILVPSEAQMSVIKGAVLFGHNPEDIRSRVARKTYGYQHLSTFDPERHKSSKKIKREGRELCEDLFRAFVQKGDEVDVGDKKISQHNPVTSDQDGMDIQFYCLDERSREVQYTDEDGMQRLGSMHIDMPDMSGGRNREVKLQITFGGTEIQAEAHDLTSGNEAKTTFNFLAG